MHLLAFSGIAASGHCAATADGLVAHARTCLGGVQRASRRGHGVTCPLCFTHS
jgi:hypothetical protein